MKKTMEQKSAPLENNKLTPKQKAFLSAYRRSGTSATLRKRPKSPAEPPPLAEGIRRIPAGVWIKPRN
jgi:hypothetical protein